MARAKLSRTLAAAVICTALHAVTASAVARADQLEIRNSPTWQSDLPGRGMTMTTVQARFGAPNAKLNAVGKPPITRWEYPTYIVYFEYQNVIHSVPKHSLS